MVEPKWSRWSFTYSKWNSVNFLTTYAIYFFLLCVHIIMFFFESVPFIRDGITGTKHALKDQINSPKPLENVKILEIGCGAGILTEV